MLEDVYGFNILNIILHTIIAIVITLILGKFHEVLHAFKAKKLGYKVNKISLWKNETDIEINENDPNHKKIAYFPYYVMFPLGILLIIFGWQPWKGGTFIFGVLISGVAIIFLHCLSLIYEGKDLNDKMLCMSKESSDDVDKKESI